MTALIDFPVERTRTAPRAKPRHGRGVAFDPASAAVPLLREADRALLDAEWEVEPEQRFTAAYLAALRGAAAMLALRGRPHRGRSKPTSAWTLLTNVAPELVEWSAFFAAFSSTNAALKAGIQKPVDKRLADDLIRQTGRFLGIVERAMEQPA